jgi:hypothetical protein
MNSRLRQERTNFLLFLGAAYMSLMCALPIITASLAMHYPRASASVAAPQPATFERLDRDRDGYVDRAEAAALPELDNVFNEADRRSDGRLDKVEFARALGMITDRHLRAEGRP